MGEKKGRSTSTPQLKNLGESISETIITEACKSKQIGIITQESSTSFSQQELERIITEDGILCSIISSLPLNEAVKTCVLSPRWRHIWTNLPILKFDTCMLDAHTRRLILDASLTTEERYDLLERKTDQFIQSVDSVLQQHQGARLQDFIIHYYLTKIHSHHLDVWVRFALASKTKKLGLCLHKPYFKEVEIDPYDFPCQLLRSLSFLEELSLSCCSFKPPCKFDGLSHLKRLNLFYVDITEEDINHLLSNCCNLENLNLWSAPRLETLSIPHTVSHFRFLLVKQCYKLKKININPVNLGKLRYSGPPVDFTIRESPQLKAATIIFNTQVLEPNLDFYLKKLTSNLSHLQSLVLYISGVSKVSYLPKGSGRFINLTHLEWAWNVNNKMSILCLATLLDSAPLLEEFKLNLQTQLRDRTNHRKQQSKRAKEPLSQSIGKLWSMLPEHPRPNLKTIEIHNFYWDKWQIKITVYLLKNATGLKSMTLPKGWDSATEIPENDIKNLSQEVLPNVKLVII